MVAKVPIPYLVLIGIGFLGLGATGMTFIALSTVIDGIQMLIRRLRRFKPTFWHTPDIDQESE